MAKGSTNPVSWITVGINLMLVIVVSIFMLSVYVKFTNEDKNTYYLESRMLFESLVYDKNCLAYNDNFKTYHGIIDIKKISDLNLENCYSRKDIGYIISLSDIKNNKITSASSNPKMVNFIPICKTLKEFKCIEKKEYILYFKDDKINQGFLTTEVITYA